MYTLLITDDNELISTVQNNIIQGTSLIDKIHILSPKFYQNTDLTTLKTSLEYVLPQTGNYRKLELTRSNELFLDKIGNEWLEYTINVNSDMTSESGELKVRILFTNQGNDTIIVRKTEMGSIYITPSENYANTSTPDTSLTVEFENDDINWTNFDNYTSSTNPNNPIIDENGNVYEFESDDIDWDNLDSNQSSGDSVASDEYETEDIVWSDILNNDGGGN